MKELTGSELDRFLGRPWKELVNPEKGEQRQGSLKTEEGFRVTKDGIIQRAFEPIIEKNNTKE